MKMQVAWFHRFGEPEEMVLEETQCPTPGPGEALVRVRATGVNHVDLDVRAGTARVPIQFPHILGREFAGEVAAEVEKWAGPDYNPKNIRALLAGFHVSDSCCC